MDLISMSTRMIKQVSSETLTNCTSLKRIRRNDKFQLINKIRRTRVRTFIKKVESFIEKKDKKNAQLAFVEAQPEMHRSVAKGVFKRNTISRKLSRLSNKIKFLK